MSDSRRLIPITPAAAERQEIGGCAEAEPYALRVLGDSMAPEFLDGHVIIVDSAMPAAHGAYVIVDYAGETTFRQFVIEAGRKFLKPLNGAYPVVEITGSCRVRGVIVQRAGRRREDRKHYSSA
jgi:SOS-response transcriptional repressor LexA